MSKRNWAYDGEKAKYAPMPDEPKSSPGKKNTKRWCRGKVGVEHSPEIRLSKRAESTRQYVARNRTLHSVGCRWLLYYVRGTSPEPHYACEHQRVCTTCGKIVEHYIERTDCPEYVGEFPYRDVLDTECLNCGQAFHRHSDRLGNPCRVGDKRFIWDSKGKVNE